MSTILFADDQVIISDTEDKLQKSVQKLTLILLACRIWWTPNNASKWQMGFKWAFKYLNQIITEHGLTISVWRKNGWHLKK
jgi:hypothetical protein